MTKKSMAGFGVIVALILVLAAGGVIIYLSASLLLKSGAIADNQKCKTSFFMTTMGAKLHTYSVGTVDVPSFVDCERKEITVDYDSSVRIGSRIDDEKVKAKIMQSILECWDITGSGKLEPGKGNKWIYNDDERYCLICSEIVFSKKFQDQAKKQGYELKGLLYYAMTRKLPGQKQTAYQKIGGSPVPSPLELVNFKELDDKNIFELSAPYSIFWRMDIVKESLSQRGFTAIGSAAQYLSPGGAVLSVLGKIADNLVVADDKTLMTVNWYPTESGVQTPGFGMGNLLADPKLRSEIHIAPTLVMGSHKAPNSNEKYCTYMMN